MGQLLLGPLSDFCALVQKRRCRCGPGRLANPRRLAGHGAAAGHTLGTAQRGHRHDIGRTVARPGALRGSWTACPLCRCGGAAGGHGDPARQAGAAASDTEAGRVPHSGERTFPPTGRPPSACQHLTPPEYLPGPVARATRRQRQRVATLRFLPAPETPKEQHPRASQAPSSRGRDRPGGQSGGASGPSVSYKGLRLQCHHGAPWPPVFTPLSGGEAEAEGGYAGEERRGLTAPCAW